MFLNWDYIPIILNHYLSIISYRCLSRNDTYNDQQICFQNQVAYLRNTLNVSNRNSQRWFEFAFLISRNLLITGFHYSFHDMFQIVQKI